MVEVGVRDEDSGVIRMSLCFFSNTSLQLLEKKYFSQRTKCGRLSSHIRFTALEKLTIRERSFPFS